MTEIVEQAVKEFNEGQRVSRSIKKTFRSAGQDPWVECEVEFKAHLDKLATLPSYSCKTIIMGDNIQNCKATLMPERVEFEDGQGEEEKEEVVVVEAAQQQQVEEEEDEVVVLEAAQEQQVEEEVP